MNTSKTIVKETVKQDIQRRPDTQAPGAPDVQGRKVGDEIRIEITPDRIRLRAYEISVARNGGSGDEVSDWCQAERELNGKSGSVSACAEPACDQPTLEIKTRTQSPCSAAAGGAGTGSRGGL